MRAGFLAITVASLFWAGCGPNCQSTCRRIYSDQDCGIATPGQDWTDVYSECVAACDDALDVPGDLDGYDPDERNVSGDKVILENEKQAAAWMDCVAETACEGLEDGYCAPI